MGELPDPETTNSVLSLLAKYCLAMDSGAFREWVDLFTADGRMMLASGDVVGHQALLLFAEAARRGIHLSGLPVVWVNVDRSVQSSCPWIFVELATGSQAVGYYHDTLDWSEGRYRFRSRRVEMHRPPVASS
jgi:hypothetical protein